MKRSEALKILLTQLSEKELVVTTTGMTSREAFSAKDREGNFYMLGSMGLVTPLSLGLALNCPDKKIIAIEGDGSVLLNLGSLAMVGAEQSTNLLTIVLDNGTYESTGGQKCISQNLNLSKIAKAIGYKNVFFAEDTDSLSVKMSKLLKLKGPNFLLIKIESSHEEGIPRVSHTPEQIKERFIKALNS